MRAVLATWAENNARLQPGLLQSNTELVGLSKNLSILGSIGSRALEYLRPGNAPPEGWAEQQIAALDEIEKRVAEVNLAAVRPVRILVEGTRHSGNK